MKFAKEIERDLVPEWRLKYLDYKVRIQSSCLA
jgi:SPX domain protein involved in polyphosphate accumulation